VADLPENRAKSPVKRLNSLSTKERIKEARLKEAKLEDLNSAMGVNKQMCSRIDEAIDELRIALQLAVKLEHSGVREPKDRNEGFSRNFRSVIRGLSTLRDQAVQNLEDAESRKEAHLEAHRTVCVSIDSAISRVLSALEAATTLDRVSSYGFNVEARLNRRLGVRDVVHTIHTAHSLLLKSVKTSRAKASSNGHILVSLVDDVGPVFE